jgi:putative membrane protein insertion efficiency factor
MMRFASGALLWLVRVYRYAISPFLGQHCRFHPSCSEYLQQAIVQHGLGRGLLMGVRRLSCCHPWHPGGFDPVPSVKPEKHASNSH